jgi:hypothetical protein
MSSSRAFAGSKSTNLLLLHECPENHCSSIVAGGLDVTLYVTSVTPSTSFTIRFETYKQVSAKVFELHAVLEDTPA